MIVRHVVGAANVDSDGFVIDATLARHCVIYGGSLFDLSGPVDPLTHLNADFREHSLGACVVAAELWRGATVLRDDEGIMRFAQMRKEAIAHLGQVDLDARRLDWLAAHRARRAQAGG